MLTGSKRLVAPSPDHFGEFSLSGKFPGLWLPNPGLNSFAQWRWQQQHSVPADGCAQPEASSERLESDWSSRFSQLQQEHEVRVGISVSLYGSTQIARSSFPCDFFVFASFFP